MGNIHHTQPLDRDILIYSIVNSLRDDEMVKFLDDLIEQLRPDVVRRIQVVRKAADSH